MMLAFFGILVVIVLAYQYPWFFIPAFIILVLWALTQDGSGSYSESSGGYSSYSSHSSHSSYGGGRRAYERREVRKAQANAQRQAQRDSFNAYRSSMNNVMKRAADSGVSFAGSRSRSSSSRSSRSSSRSGSFGGGKSRGGGSGRSF